MQFYIVSLYAMNCYKLHNCDETNERVNPKLYLCQPYSMIIDYYRKTINSSKNIIGAVPNLTRKYLF